MKAYQTLQYQAQVKGFHAPGNNAWELPSNPMLSHQQGGK